MNPELIKPKSFPTPKVSKYNTIKNKYYHYDEKNEKSQIDFINLNYKLQLDSNKHQINLLKKQLNDEYQKNKLKEFLYLKRLYLVENKLNYYESNKDSLIKSFSYKNINL